MEPEPGDWIKISLHNFCSQSLCWCSLDVSCYINKQRRLAHMGVKKYSYRLLCSILFPDVQGLQTMRSCTVLISGHVTEFVRGRLLWRILFAAVQGPPNHALLYCSDLRSCDRVRSRSSSLKHPFHSCARASKPSALVLFWSPVMCQTPVSESVRHVWTCRFEQVSL